VRGLRCSWRQTPCVHSDATRGRLHFKCADNHPWLDQSANQAHCNMGVIFKEDGRLEEAVTAYDRALQVGGGCHTPLGALDEQAATCSRGNCRGPPPSRIQTAPPDSIC
jgi:hypothetical protein